MVTNPPEFNISAASNAKPAEARSSSAAPPPPLAPDVDDAQLGGKSLAEDMETKGYQPVILFGNAFSGKTSLLLSLLASVKTEADLKTGLYLAEPLLPRDSTYGRFQAEQADAFFGRKTQDFIEGTASPKTAIELPFFVPVSFRPDDKPTINFAFMESNGEWYRPDRSGDKLHPKLRTQIEDFIGYYQKGIIFIHLLPFTQQAVRSANADAANDTQEVRDAALAVEGAVRAYERVRVDKRSDTHIMLVTKWDAYDDGNSRSAALESVDRAAVETFAMDRYDKAVTALRGMGLEKGQVSLTEYCAGIINERGVVVLRRDNAMRSVVLSYPKNLWSYMYRQALGNRGEPSVSPFPAPPARSWWTALLERLF